MGPDWLFGQGSVRKVDIGAAEPLGFTPRREAARFNPLGPSSTFILVLL